MSALSAEARRREIKLATGELVHAVGGIEAAAELIGKGKSQVHRCTSVNDDDSFLNARDLAELERRSAVPFMTRLLAKLAGGVFLKLPEDFGDAAELPSRVMELAEELGDVSARVREAVADGVVRPREAEAVERELDELIEKAVATRALVRGMQGKDRPRIVPAGEREADHG